MKNTQKSTQNNFLFIISYAVICETLIENLKVEKPSNKSEPKKNFFGFCIIMCVPYLIDNT